MLIQPTLDALNRLKLNGMALALSEQMTNPAAQQLAFEERIALLLEREVIHRENSRMGRLWKACQAKERGAVSKTSTTADAPAWTAHSSPASPPASGSARARTC